MHVHVFMRSTADDQSTAAARFPQNLIRIEGCSDEVGEPRLLIREALRAFGPGKVVASRRKKVALKIIGLLFAASIRAQNIRDWSRNCTYDPLPDFLTLQRLAEERFGPARDATNPVSKLRDTLKNVVRTLCERPA